MKHAVLLLALLHAALARADDHGGAKAHIDRGSSLYQQGRYDEAFAELSAGYQLDPRPELLYSLGQTERKRGHCKEAIEYYERYLATRLPRERMSAVLVQIDRCRAELDRPVEPRAAPPPIVATPPPAPPSPAPAVSIAVPLESPPPPQQPVYKKWWLWTSLGVVVAVGVGVGVGLGVSSSSSGTASNRANFQPTLPDLVIKR
jgi:tetratricopeptide (TPR) repeat protein